jgi:hypothetical protein
VSFTFKSVDEYSERTESDQLEGNLIAFLQWGLLNVGCFQDAGLSTALPFGGDGPATLKPVTDRRYTAGQVWEGLRTDWVWESGLGYARQPVAVSGVYVDGTFHASPGSGAHAHTVNYPLGQVFFTTPLPTGSLVKVEHSYRTVQVRSADEPWFQTLQFRSLRADEPQAADGGARDVLAQNRVQLPAVVVESVGNARCRAAEIGSLARWERLDVEFVVLAETPGDRKRLHDIIVAQWERTLQTFDRNAAPMPLAANGALASGARTYPELCQAYPWQNVRFADVRSGDVGQIGKQLFLATVRGTFEIPLP